MEEEESEDGRGVLEGSRTEAGSLESLLGVAAWRLLGRDGEVEVVTGDGIWNRSKAGQQRRRKPEIATVGEVAGARASAHQ